MPDEQWSWDPTLFAGSASYYARGRLPYSPHLAEAVQRTLDLDPAASRLLDVGCGPGTVTLALAPLFVEAVGVDADADMIAAASRAATDRNLINTRWVHAHAEDLPRGLGRFTAVTFAASFHWMDRPKVAGTVRTMLHDDGVVIHIDSWQYALRPDVISEVCARYLGDDRRAGQSVRNSSPGDEDDVFRAAGFVGPDRVAVPDGRELSPTIDDLVADTFSRSSSAPHLFGDRVEEFETELRTELAAALPDGRWTVKLPDNGLKIWRPR